MSLAFALMAAINGSTGSSATLSFGLNGTKPRRRQPSGSEILIPRRWRRKLPETLSCESAEVGTDRCQNARNGPTSLSRSARSQPPSRQRQRPRGGLALPGSRFSSLRGWPARRPRDAVGKTTQRSGASIGRGTPPSESLQDRAVPGTTTVNRAGSGRLVPPLTAQRNFACVYPTATWWGSLSLR